MLDTGTTAPDFTVDDDGGNPVSSADLRGNWALLWFYPKASTPG